MKIRIGRNRIRTLIALVLLGTAPAALHAARAPIETRSQDPYLGAIVVDADTGTVLFEDHADARGYPASVIKLMDMMVLLEQVGTRRLSLNDVITVSAASSRMGGSQVYLKEGETFTVEELFFALMIQSANDAAVALAERAAGSPEGFTRLMNDKAAALGMTNSEFHSVHGLPPGAGQDPDVSTARDLARLARALLSNTAILRYTAVRDRGFRDNTFQMQNHNRLLDSVDGCDGLKTGYFTAGGFSIVATAKRDGRRVIAVVLGSRDRKVRDAKATELLALGFSKLAEISPVPPPPPAAATASAATATGEDDASDEEPSARKRSTWRKPAALGFLAGLLTAWGLAWLMRRNAPWQL